MKHQISTGWGDWTVERADGLDTIRDPAGELRYEGREGLPLLTLSHFAMALAREQECMGALRDVLEAMWSVAPYNAIPADQEECRRAEERALKILKPFEEAHPEILDG
jgi:hypothetical protein